MPQGPYLRKYGVQTTIPITLFEVDGVDFRVDAADGGTDCSITKDEGAEITCDNDFADEGTGYSLVLSATEMEAARITVYVVDQSGTKVWLDTSIIVETYGHASAMHAFDLDLAEQTVALSTQGKADVNVEVDSAWTTQMADSVPADGTISTREQALYALLQILTEFAIAGVTMTVKKVDGATTLMTFTLDNDTNPTSLSRTT